MRQIIAAFLGAVIACNAFDAACAAGPGWGDSKTTAANSLVQNFLTPKSGARTIIPRAISVAIGSNGNLHYARGWGEARPSVPAAPETVYKVGSISKQFTAAAILRLVEAQQQIAGSSNILTLDTEISSIFGTESAWHGHDRPPLTIRSLLLMKSNMPNFTQRPPPSLDPWGPAAADVLRRAFMQMEPSGWPGSFDYSNTGYFLLSEVIHTTADRNQNQSYGSILQDLVIGRAHLSNTGLAADATLQSKLASPHFNRRPAFTQPDWLQGSGDLASSVLDLFKWNTALMREQVIGPAMMKEMFSDGARVDVWTYYGMGWFIKHVAGYDEYFHSGTVPGYTGFNLIVRRASGDWHSVSILTNSDGVEGLDDLADRLSELMLSQ